MAINDKQQRDDTYNTGISQQHEQDEQEDKIRAGISADIKPTDDPVTVKDPKAGQPTLESRYESEAAQEPEMVRTIGQMRALIMDYPSSLMAANFFKAFSDGTRLLLLQALNVREMCVSDMCTMLGLSQPAISNHLRILNHQRIVKMRRSGKNIFYSLDDWHINAIIGMALEHLSFIRPTQER